MTSPPAASTNTVSVPIHHSSLGEEVEVFSSLALLEHPPPAVCVSAIKQDKVNKAAAH